jgi:hypothetical protein
MLHYRLIEAVALALITGLLRTGESLKMLGPERYKQFPRHYLPIATCGCEWAQYDPEDVFR